MNKWSIFVLLLCLPGCNSSSGSEEKPDRAKLRSGLRQIVSIARETELFLERAQEGALPKAFIHSHQKYLLDEIDELRDMSKDWKPATELQRPFLEYLASQQALFNELQRLGQRWDVIGFSEASSALERIAEQATGALSSL